MTESSSTPENSEKPVHTESERDKYWDVVNKAISWSDRKPGMQFRYDSQDWRMQYWVMSEMMGPMIHVKGFEMTPPPKQLGFLARLRGQKPEPVQENSNKVMRHWTISWGRTPDQQYVIYEESPYERPEGIEGKTPATTGGFWSADGNEPKDWASPKAEDYKKVDPFEAANRMLRDLETSTVHEEGRYWTKRK